ncbi:phage tail sheath subtilisin-like domain-containing protein [Amantichitinum ursilacus]|uniref:Phage tail sheath protein n=1 Tax=Amantichitinum ursilacus TaxID=857265 RepID=A0A0N0XIT2_9NEIS|nr:phage tail sheath subtilisin-like domain-containing protein [Amantichitinum ursilacus]KPC53027.1 Phage tail sheath protein [Amantichitinum ursilacus]
MQFNTLPAGVAVPLFYAEMDNSQANAAAQSQRTLLIGQMLTAGSAAANTAMIVSNVSQAKSLFGQGSMLARMYDYYRRSDPYGEIWCIALADNAAGVVATGSIAVTGTATAAGTLNVYIAGQRVQVAVSAADTAAIVATNLAAAINAAVDLPVTAAAATGTVTLTARWKGSTGNDIKLQLNYRGLQGGETTPAGVTVAMTAMAAGATDPSLANAILAMGDDEYDWIVHPYTDSANLGLLQTELGDISGRWSAVRQIYGHAYSALRGTLSSLVTFGQSRNDQHQTVAGFEASVPNPVWEFAAAYAAANAVCLRADPARPTQTASMVDVLPAPGGQRFVWTDRSSLLGYGIATSTARSGVMLVERAVTTYQKNSFGQADASYLDSETLFTSMAVLRRLRARITQKFPRHKLADDGTRFATGQAIITPGIARGELVDEYMSMMLDGLVENYAAFAKALIVQRNSTNPNRLDVLLPPDYINQLRVFAVLNQFRLQYPANAAN